MAKRAKAEVPQEAPVLQVPLTEAQRLIRERIELGKPILMRTIHDLAGLEEARAEYGAWHDFNRDLLRKIFSNSSISDEYVQWFGGVVVMNQTLGERIEDYRGDVKEKINRLESIYGRLPLYDNGVIAPAAAGALDEPEYSRRVFVIHGHDDNLKTEVARLLERLSFDVVILHEQPNRGRTIIEKFENYSDVGFAVALLTPDDVGAKMPTGNTPPDLVPRARQNVIFELGFFIGKLSRYRVVALYKPTMDILTDFTGVLYTLVDSHGAWKLELANELKAAGYEVDLGRIT